MRGIIRPFIPERWYGRTVYRGALAFRGERGVFSSLRQLQHLDANATPVELLRRQDAKLERLLGHASAASPFYKAHWPDLRPIPKGEVRSHLRTLPLLEKRHLQTRDEDMRTGEGRSALKRTGGSTAEPVVIQKSAGGMACERAVSWLGYGWFGIQPGDRVARFWGAPLTTRKALSFALADLAMHRVRFSAFAIEPSDLDGYWRRCQKFRPAWLYGYTTIIDLFARHLEERGHDGRSLGLKAVVCTSEPLDDIQRTRMERVFGAPVQNEYGCGETGAIAYSCERGNLHVMTESVLVEVLDEAGVPVEAGDTGELVVTDLNNFAQPLVRYRIRDYATVGEACSCGRPWPTLQKVLGRVHDVVYTPAGRRWHGEQIDYLMVDIYNQTHAFYRYQAVQKSPDLLELRLITEDPISESVRERIATYVRDRLDGMHVEVRRVDRIERSRSGKMRVVKNEWMDAQRP